MRVSVSLVLLVAATVLAEDGLPLPSSTRTASGAPTYAELAAAYAPTVYQDIDDSKYGGRPDIPISLGFDGNRTGDDNWRSFDDIAKRKRRGDLGANVYWAVTETPTHYYINYSFFYPQDWDDSSGVSRWFQSTFADDPEHENDLETILVVVEKTPDDRLGRLVLLETQAHNVFHVYGDSSRVQAGTKSLEGPILADGRHPRIFIESKGHGIYGKHDTLTSGKFPGGDGVVLRPGEARDPFANGEFDGKVESTYGLRSTEQEMLPLAFAPTGEGQPSANPGDYRGARYSSARPIAFSISGDDHKKNAANYPWGQDEDGDGVARGDWFFDPALAVSVHVKLPGSPSLDYTRNAYLDAVRTEARACPAPSRSVGVVNALRR